MPEGNLHGHMTGLGTLGGHMQGSGTTDYNELNNKPKINNVTLVGNKTSNDLNLQEKINFNGDGSTYLNGEGNFTTPAGSGGSYSGLTDKPSINGVELDGNLSLSDLDIQEELDFPDNPLVFLNGQGNFIAISVDYDNIANKPEINGHTLSGNQTSDDLGLQDKLPFNSDPNKFLNGAGSFTEVTADYSDLSNKPSIGGVELDGDKSAAQLGLQEVINFPNDPDKYLDGQGNFKVPGYAATAGSAAEADHATAADTADTAEAITVGSYSDTNDCYIERAIPEDSQIEYQKITGASLVWNQLVDTGTTTVYIPSGQKYILYSGGTYTKGTSDGSYINVSIGDMVFNLTLMFGSTMADAITAEQFSALFPESAYAYDTGSIQSVNVSSHKAYDSNNVEVSSITLDSSKEFRGFYSISDGKIITDGDIYASDGTIARNYRILAGNAIAKAAITSVSTTQSGFTVFWLYLADKTGRVICDEAPYLADYAAVTSNPVTSVTFNPNYDQSIRMILPTILVGNSVDDIYDYLQNNSIYFVYKLRTPTTDSASPYTNPQLIDADGTEKFIDYGVDQGTRDASIPVGVDSSFLLEDGVGSLKFPEVPGSGDYVLASHDGIIYWLQS